MSHILLPEFVVPENSELVAIFDRVRRSAPLIHCITNSVVTGFTANVVLALGGSPAMVDLPQEAEIFAGVADAVLINLGTPQADHRAAMLEAAASASSHGKPWVLDPVAVGSLPVRTALAQDLLAYGPTVIRANASEVVALAGFGSGGRGTDSSVPVDDAVDAAAHLVGLTGAVVCISGQVDVIVSAPNAFDALQVTKVVGGSDLLTKVTGGGCALGAVVAAFLAAEPKHPEVAAALAHSAYGVAAQKAAELSSGPGSFAVHFLDALSSLTAADVVGQGQIQWA